VILPPVRFRTGFEGIPTVSINLTVLRVPLASWLVITLLAALAVVGLPGSPAQAAGSPNIGLTMSAPATVLLGGQASYSLTVTNPAGPGAAFNVSFSDVLPVGVSYVAGSTSPADAGDPTIITDKPAIGQTTLIWRNVGDVQLGGDLTLGFKATPSLVLLPVASTFTNTATSYASSDPRQIAAFSATGVVTPTSFTSSATATGTPTQVTAIEIHKSEPSPEHELVRGVHDNTTVYTLVVTNNTPVATNAITVTDFLPAGLEFLGCGGVDNSAPGVEYTGAPRLTAGLVTVTNCLTPSTVDTVTDPPGRPAGVYTQVTWSIGDLGGAAVKTITYRAGIPLLKNTMTFPGGTPTGLGQTANLDNNTGASTAETGTEQAYANHAQATGTYMGTVFGGGSHIVTASDDLTVTSEDLAMQKSVAPTAFTGGGIATYTLKLQTSEYRQAAGIVITDHIPNGVCPLSPTTNFASGTPSECDPGAGFAPTGATIASATQLADGSFDLVFNPVASLAHNGTLTITYQGRMRATYTGNGGGVSVGSPTVAGDSFTNTVSLDGTSQPLATNPPDPAGNVTVHDDSSATQTSSGPSIDKTIAQRAVSMDCSTGAYVDTPTALSRPAFHLGDRVCFQLRVNFPGSNPTRNAVVTDFLPAGLTYEAGSATTGPGNTVPSGQISFNESATVAGTADPAWTLGADDGTGVRFVQVGKVLVVRLSAIIGTPAAGVTPDVVGNLMKLRSENSPGHAVSLRDQVDLLITPAPGLQVRKGVASVNGLPSPINGPNVDGSSVRQGDLVVFRVDVKNLGNSAAGSDQTVRALRVLDALPTGVTCARVSVISDSGTCFDAADVGRPSVNPTTASVLLWALPQSDTIAAGATRPSLTYTMKVPDVASVSAVFTNTAGVSQYDADTDIVVGGVTRTTTYYPKTNIDTTILAPQQNAPVAADTSNVVIRNALVAKTGVTSIDDGTTNNLASQAVVGELVTYTLTATVPWQSTVFNAAFSDALPTGLTFVSATAAYSATGTLPATGSLPSGVTQNSTTGALAFPATYSNNTTTDELFAVTLVARVSTLAGNAQGTIRTNTASFNSTTLVAAGSAIAARTSAYAVTVVVPSPTLAKGDDTTGKIVVAGQVVTYTLTAGNLAGRPASKDTVVIDCVPAGLTFAAYGVPSQGATVADVAGTGSNGCANNTRRLEWDAGTVLTGPATLTYTATVDPASAGQTSYLNNALLTGSTLADGVNDASGSTIERAFTATATDTLTVQGATVTKVATPTVPTVGERVTYTVTATIPASVNLYDAAIIDALPAGIDVASIVQTAFTCTSSLGDCIATIPGGGAALTNASTLHGWSLGDVLSVPQVRTVVATYTAVVGDVPANVRGLTLTNTATVRWDGTDGANPTSAGATFLRTSPNATASVVVQEPSLTVAKSVNDTTPDPGQDFTYTVTVTNSAALNVSAAFDAVVADVVPAGVVVDEATITGGAYDGPSRTITWTIPGPIASGGSVTRSYHARFAASPILTAAGKVNTVTVTSYHSLSGGGRTYTQRPSASATVTPSFPSITPTKTAVTAGQAFVGTSFTWRVTLTNPGPAKAFGVDAVDALPPNWTYDVGSASAVVAGGSSTAVEPTVATSSGVQTLRWTDLGDLTTGQAAIVTYTATPTAAAATASPGAGLSVAHTNTVNTTWEDATTATGNSSAPYAAGPATAVAHIASADVTLTKSHTGSFTAGGTGTWNIVVANSGPDTADGPFTVSDTLPAGTTIVSVGGTGWTCSTSTVSCTRTSAADTLANSAAFPVVTVVVNVAPGVPAGPTLTNSATVTEHTFDPSPANNTGTDVAPVVASADLRVTKTHPTGANPISGQPFTWTVAVTNLGPSVSRAPITVTDTLPAGVTFVSAAGSGWACSASGQVVTCTSAADLSLNEVSPDILVTANVAANTTGSLSNVAHVSGTTPDPTPGNDNATDTAAVDTRADLVLTKDHVGAFLAGSTGTYRFRVQNLGSSDAASPVRITDALPNGLTATGVTTNVRGVWTCTGSSALVCTLTGSLAAGDSATVDVEVQIPSSVTSDVHNTATVSSGTTDINPANNTDDDQSTLTTQADLRIVKSHTGPAIAGDDLAFTLAVRNIGPSDSPGTLHVSDGLPTGLTFVSASGTGWLCSSANDVVTCDLAAGLVSGADAAPITLTALIGQGAGPATLSNTATVQGPLTDPTPGNNSSTDTVNVVDDANVSITKTVTSPTGAVPAGENIAYNLHVTNDGPSTADTMVVADALPIGTTLVSADGPGWTCSAGPTVSCTRATQVVGSSDITLVVHVDSTVLDGTTIHNTATVDTSTPGDAPGDNTDSANITVVAEADLRLVKTHRVDPATAGRTVTFDLAVHNAGPSAAQHAITVIDHFPVGLTFVSAGSDWTCTAAPVTGAGQDVTCELDGTDPLDSGNDAPLLTLVAQVASDVTPGTFVNTADVDSATTDPVPANNDASDPVAVHAVVDLSVVKTHTGPVRIGDPLTFSLVVGNDGPSAATHVVLSDTAPTGLTPATSVASHGWTCAVVGQQVTCLLDDPLAAGATAPPLSLTYDVRSSAYPSVDNRAEVASDGTEAHPADNSSVDTVQVPPRVDLQVSKSHVGSPQVGSETTYALLVSNAGPTTDPGPITVADTLPVGLRYVAATGDGWSCVAAGAAVTCTRADGLAEGAATTVLLRVDVLPAAYPSVSNVASVSTPSEDIDATNNTDTDPATVIPLVDLAVTKRLTTASDGRATWTITVLSRGPNAADLPFTVVDQLPAGLAYISMRGDGWSCADAGKHLTCTHGEPLAVGDSTTITVVTRITAAAGTSVTNNAVVASVQDSDVSNNTDAAVLAVSAHNLSAGQPRSIAGLPRTGADVARLLALSLLLLVAGVGVLRAGRRRETQE
jgi:large repetitive protein